MTFLLPMELFRVWVTSSDGHLYIMQVDEEWAAWVQMQGRSVAKVMTDQLWLRHMDRCIVDELKPPPTLLQNTKGACVVEE